VIADSTDAVILVGGMGTRLRPLTMSAPKPMLPIAGVPFLTHVITRIRDAGITHIVLGTSYQAEVFSTYFGDGSKLGVELEYVVETEPLGTGGGIRNVAPALRGDTVVVFNGDILSGADLRGLLAVHESRLADVTLQPEPAWRTPGVRLRAHRRGRKGNRILGEGPRTDHRSNQRGHLRLQTCRGRHHPEWATRVRRTKKRSRACWHPAPASSVISTTPTGVT